MFDVCFIGLSIQNNRFMKRVMSDWQDTVMFQSECLILGSYSLFANMWHLKVKMQDNYIKEKKSKTKFKEIKKIALNLLANLSKLWDCWKTFDLQANLIDWESFWICVVCQNATILAKIEEESLSRNSCLAHRFWYFIGSDENMKHIAFKPSYPFFFAFIFELLFFEFLNFFFNFDFFF